MIPKIIIHICINVIQCYSFRISPNRELPFINVLHTSSVKF